MEVAGAVLIYENRPFSNQYPKIAKQIRTLMLKTEIDPKTIEQTVKRHPNNNAEKHQNILPQIQKHFRWWFPFWSLLVCLVR